MNKIRIIIVLAFLLIAGMVLTVTGISDIMKMRGEVKDINFDSLTGIRKGDIIHGELFSIYGSYAGETTTETTFGIETSSYTSREYFVMELLNDDDYEKELYISVSASKAEDRNLLYTLSKKTREFYSGNQDVVWPEDNYFVFRVDNLDPELMNYMVEFFGTDYFPGGRAELERHILPYDLIIYDPNSAYRNLMVGIVMMAIPIVVVVVVIMIRKKGANNISPDAGPAFNGYSQANSGMESVNTSGTYGNTSGTYNMNTPAGMQATSASSDMTNASNQTAQNAQGFSESSFAPPPAPIPYIPQPVQADEFFAKPERKPKPAAVAKPAAPKPAASQPASEPKKKDYGQGIDTSDLDTDSALLEQEKNVKSNYDPTRDNNRIETDDLDTDKALHEQEQAIKSNYDPSRDNNKIETDELDTDKALYEQEQAVKSNYDPSRDNNKIETDDLDTDKVLYEQEQAVTSNYDPSRDNNTINTDDLDMGDLGYFDQSAEGGDDDVFDFANDFDYEIDPSKIEISE